MDVAKIGEQLNVGTILEGSVQKSGNKIRVTAQLIDVSNGYHLWSGTFDRNLDDVFAIQDEIATEVVAALKVSLLGEDVERLDVGQTDNVDAYTEYLHAINDLNSQSIDTLTSAVAHLQEAIRLDPNYAQAYSTLGRAYLDMRGYGAMRFTEAVLAARNAATRALDLSPESSEALAVLGAAEGIDGNMEVAGQLLLKAIEIAPNDSVALSYYGRYLGADARPDEAILTYQKLLRLDPLNETNFIRLGASLAFNQRYAEAREVFGSLEHINSKNPSLGFNQGMLQFRQGNWAAAIAPILESVNLDPDDPEGATALGRIYLALDMPEQAAQSFDRAVEMDPNHPVSRSAPLLLNLYLQQNGEENFQLARELLKDRIDDRRGSRYFALYVLIDGAGKTDRHHIALELLDNLYPHLFDDPPRDLDKDRNAVFFAGRALMQSGDIDRGSHLIESYLAINERYDEAYHVEWQSIAGQLLIGDRNAALEKLDKFANTNFFHTLDKTFLQHDSAFDPIRDEPAFIALMDEYRENAAEQRQILQAMNKDGAGQ
jgi:tetratricopeptide (TPR) repeat protein